jgi:class 3 adenylate cyclase
MAADELRALFPHASALALGLLAEEEECATDAPVAVLRIDAESEAQRRALHAAMPKVVALRVRSRSARGRADSCSSRSRGEEDAATRPAGFSSSTSVQLVCSSAASRGCVIADSSDWPRGVAAFEDWQAAAAGTGSASFAQYVTAGLLSGAGTHCLGFVVLCFPRAGGFKSAHNGMAAYESLRQLCEAVGTSVAVRRERDAKEASARALSAATTLACNVFPPHMLDALVERVERQRLLTESNEAHGIGRQQRAAYEDAGYDHALMETHDSVTVVCIDISGFSQLGSSRTAEQMLGLVDALWQRFDVLVSSHGVYKLETAGDQYLAVSGMYPPRSDHAHAALRLALDMHAAAASVAADEGATLRIRVGLHSGAVTCGVAGSLRAQLCIFGDTVRIANKMNAACAAGCVQLSGAAADACGVARSMLAQQHVEAVSQDGFALEAGTRVAEQVLALLDAASTPAPHEQLDDVACVREQAGADEEGGPAEAAASDDDEEDVATGRRPLWLNVSHQRSSVCFDKLSPTPRVHRGSNRTSASASTTTAEDAAAADTRDAQLMREQCTHHFCAQLLAASGMLLLHVALSLGLGERSTALVVGAVTAVLSLLCVCGGVHAAAC